VLHHCRVGGHFAAVITSPETSAPICPPLIGLLARVSPVGLSYRKPPGCRSAALLCNGTPSAGPSREHLQRQQTPTLHRPAKHPQRADTESSSRSRWACPVIAICGRTGARPPDLLAVADPVI
jgi:hypothetical protein